MTTNAFEDGEHDGIVEVLNFLADNMRDPMTYRQIEAAVEAEFADVFVPAVSGLKADAEASR